MFLARLNQASILKKIVDSIKELVNNVNLDAGPTAISMQAMDPSHVALVSLTLKEGGFAEYRSDGVMTLGIGVQNLAKVLKLADGDDIITLKAEEQDPSFLTLIFEDNKSEKYSEFNLNLLQLDSEQLAVPDTEYSSVVTMSSSEFARICKEMSQLSETVTIETSKEAIKFSVQGDTAAGSTTIKASQQMEDDNGRPQTILEVDDPVTSSFALRYLNIFNKASTLCPTVILKLTSDTPIVVEYKIENLGSVKYFLAPKINDEEEM